MNGKWLKRLALSICAGGIFSTVNCTATNKINVSAKIPNEIVVNFNKKNDHAELIDGVGNFCKVTVACDADASLKQPINVRVTGKHDTEVCFHLKGNDGNTLGKTYNVTVMRDGDYPIMSLANQEKKLKAVDTDDKARIVVQLEIPDWGQTGFTPGVTYEDILTIHVTPAE